MPVWHATTRELRESGRLALVGLVQEQHPERAELFALWQDFDWPVLWDPFTLSGSQVVPRTFLLDGQGVVRAMNPRPEQIEALVAALEAEPAPALEPVTGDNPWARIPESEWHLGGGDKRLLAEQLDVPPGSPTAQAWAALAEVLFAGAWSHDAEVLDRAIDTLGAYVAEHTDDAPMIFRLGVLLRMRLDRGTPRDGDFQAAVDAWSAALALRPSQYIWRRRLQQYGPRLDQPYPFYTWVDEARADLGARGVSMPSVGRLTEAERARAVTSPRAPEEAPDPAGTYPRDEDGWLRHESAVVFDTSRGRPRGRVHLTLTPDDRRDVHWNNETLPTLVWLDDPPAGWTLERRGFAVGETTSVVSAEARAIDFEVELPADSEGGTLTGYAIVQACEGDAGVCIALRHDFAVEIRR